MSNKKKLVLFLSAAVLLLIMYNYFNKINLSELLSGDNKIDYLATFDCSSGDTKLTISDKTEKKILDLIKRPNYYKDSSISFTSMGDLNIIRMEIVSPKNGLNVYYNYEISNNGSIRIRNRDTGKGGFYLMKRYPLYRDFKNSIEIELYNELKQLIIEDKQGRVK